MEINKFNEVLLYSNKNVEKLARKLVNESANAALMEMYGDKAILADHTTGQIFEAKYSFDGKVFSFDDFKEIKLVKKNDTLKETFEKYFNDEITNLTEAYETASVPVADVFEDSLGNAIVSKNMDTVINYNELAGINEALDELKDTAVLKEYKEYLNEAPTSSIKIFNWKDPVKVAIIDEDNGVILRKTMVNKATKLGKDPEFKKELAEAAEKSLKGDNMLMETLLEDNVALVSLDKAALKEIVGMSVIGNKDLMINRNKITESIMDTIANTEMLSEKQKLFEEEDAASGEDSKAPEVSEEDNDKVVKALEKAKEAAKDEKLIDKIDALINSLKDAASAGETDVAAVKESIEILSL